MKEAIFGNKYQKGSIIQTIQTTISNSEDFAEEDTVIAVNFLFCKINFFN